jgi:transcriptional regulator with XRE-family HTH domain
MLGDMTRSVFSPEYKRLCQLLIEARERKGLTQAELGSILRKHQPFVSKYERGERRLDVTELIDIAEALDIDPHFILAYVQSIRTTGGGLNQESFWALAKPYELMKVLEQDPELRELILSRIAELKPDKT